MSAGDKIFAGSIPENYDRYLVPLIFESYARDIARRAAALSPKAVLETAAGSGVVTRALAPKPKLLLLDEPTTGIDAAGQQRFVESIAELKSGLGLTVVIVTHDLRAISTMCDGIACLNVTLHYHNVPEHVPADVIQELT